MTLTQQPVVVKHVGVDDFALKRGSLYGTLIIDLDTGKPIELLRDRTATTLVAWLKQHPEIEVATRDRSTEYARGLSEGAPQAQQVLDRWHLVKNLREALEREVQRHREDMNSALVVEEGHTVLSLRPSSAERSSQEALERKRAQYADLYSQFQPKVLRRLCAPLMSTARQSTRPFAVRDRCFGGVMPDLRAS